MRFVPPTRAELHPALPPAKPVAQLIAWSMNVLPQWILRPFLMSFLTTALGPSPDLFKEGAILVNNRGERFTDELGKPAHAVAKQPERIAYIVFDDALAREIRGVAVFRLDRARRRLRVSQGLPAQPPRHLSPGRHARRARGLDARAAPTRSRRRSSATTPASAARGRRSRASPTTRSGPVKSYVVFTDGGLKVSERLEVLRADGSVIPRPLRGGLRGAGRPAARRPRPPPRLGFHLRPHRRPQCRARRAARTCEA